MAQWIGWMMPAANDAPLPYRVDFYCWGVACRADFGDEAAAIRWLRNAYDKGWLYPEALIAPDGSVLLNQDQLMELISE